MQYIDLSPWIKLLLIFPFLDHIFKHPSSPAVAKAPPS
jgi:hypothetical protein